MSNDKIKDTFSKNLSRQMNVNHVTQEQLSKIVGVSQQSVSNWLNMKQIPRMGVIEKISNYFGILKSDLLENKDYKKNRILDDLDLASWMGSIINSDSEELYRLLKIISSLDDDDKIKTLLVMAEALEK